MIEHPTPQEEAAELLVKAWLEGHHQIRGAMHGYGFFSGECAVGVLHLSLHPSRREAVACYLSEGTTAISCAEVAARFHIDPMQLMCMNDTEKLDFLTIGRKLQEEA